MRSAVLCTMLVVAWSAAILGQELKELTNSIGMKLVLIHAGSFNMGSPIGEAERGPNETLHEVTISKSYYLGAYEVTQNEYEKVMGYNPTTFKVANKPVAMVSWENAVSFCKKLSELPEEKVARREYQLPTDAEWEYACRASSSAAYCFGDSPKSLNEYAWYDEGRQSKTHPVGEKKANRWGLYDMHGNVLEWCQDCYSEGPSDFESVTDPNGPKTGSARVIRGGSFELVAAACRSASRGGLDIRMVSHCVGFRVAMIPPAKQPETVSTK